MTRPRRRREEPLVKRGKGSRRPLQELERAALLQRRVIRPI
jgi:hypothetical protein